MKKLIQIATSGLVTGISIYFIVALIPMLISSKQDLWLIIIIITTVIPLVVYIVYKQIKFIWSI